MRKEKYFTTQKKAVAKILNDFEASADRYCDRHGDGNNGTDVLARAYIGWFDTMGDYSATYVREGNLIGLNELKNLDGCARDAFYAFINLTADDVDSATVELYDLKQRMEVSIFLREKRKEKIAWLAAIDEKERVYHAERLEQQISGLPYS